MNSVPILSSLLSAFLREGRLGEHVITSYKWTEKRYYTQKPLNILFFGSDHVSVNVLDILQKKSRDTVEGRIIQSIEVVCGTPRNKQNKRPIEVFCEEKGIPIYQPPISDNSLATNI